MKFVEAKKTYKLKVSASALAKARRNDELNCVIAHAGIEDMIGHGIKPLQVRVTPTKVYLTSQTRQIKYSLPTEAKNAQKTFDKTGNWPVNMQVITLHPVPPSERRNYKRKEHERNGQRSGPKHRYPTNRSAHNKRALDYADLQKLETSVLG